MTIYVVFHRSTGIPTTIHSAHYSEWMARITTENMNKTLGDTKSEAYAYSATRLTAERD